jgi:predicted nucleotidyltransferase component of viral defense system
LIPRGSLDQYAAGSGVDRRWAGQNVVLTYVLKLLFDEASSKELAESLAFKGGTCLRKMFFGKPSRFSTDLDFTATQGTYERIKAMLGELLNNHTFYELELQVDEWYDVEDRTRDTCGARVSYQAEVLQGEFKLQVSLKEKPSLPIRNLPLLEESESYFKALEFGPFAVPCLTREEIIAEKLRAAFQRTRARDLYDLYFNTQSHYNRDTVKTLAVIKRWNVREAFDGEALLRKIREEEYNWEDLKPFVRRSSWVEPRKILSTVGKEYAYLTDLDETLRRISEDSRRHEESELVTSAISQLTVD